MNNNGSAEKERIFMLSIYKWNTNVAGRINVGDLHRLNRGKAVMSCVHP
jgi:hypothetical protein